MILRALRWSRRAARRYLRRSLEKFGIKERVSRLVDCTHTEYARLVGYDSEPCLSSRFLWCFRRRQRFFKYAKPGRTLLSEDKIYNGVSHATVSFIVLREHYDDLKLLPPLLRKNDWLLRTVRIFYFHRYGEADSASIRSTKVDCHRDLFPLLAAECPHFSDDEWVVFNTGDDAWIPQMACEVIEKTHSGEEIILFRPTAALYQPLRRRQTERLLNFSIRGRWMNRSGPDVKSSAFPFDVLCRAFLDPAVSSAVRVRELRVSPASTRNNWEFFHHHADAPFFDRLALRVIAEIMVRARPVEAGLMLSDIPYRQGTMRLSNQPEEENVNWRILLPETNVFDVLYLTDFRIRGGGVNSVISEIEIAVSAGLAVAVYHLEAVSYTKQCWGFKEDAMRRLAKLGVPLVNGLAELRATLAIFRYPPALAQLPSSLPSLNVNEAVIVVNQPPRRFEGDRAFYSTALCHANARRLFNLEPFWAPNGPDARRAMSEERGEIPFLDEDWLNVVSTTATDADIDRRTERLFSGNGPLTIGRHVRDVENKWPSGSEVLLQCYPERGDIQVIFLGGCNGGRRVLGRKPSNWNCFGYGEMPVEIFLEKIDAFVYFPHEKRIEPMARSIVEALASGLPVLVPTRFKGIYGDSPIYCEPQEVMGHLRKLKGDPEVYRSLCRAGRDEAIELFGASAYMQRMRRHGVTSMGYGHG